MDIIDENCVASLEFELTWKSDVGRHKENFFAHSVRSSRDLLPEKVTRVLMERSLGEQIHLSFSPRELVPPYDPHQVLTLDDRQFERRKINEHRIEPPYLTVDFNHPLAKTEMKLQITVHDVRKKESDRGGRVTDWAQAITDGPGMQARWQGRPTDFFSDDPFARSDEEDDLTFYEKPRLVTPISTVLPKPPSRRFMVPC